MNFIDQIDSERLRGIYRYWQSKCRNGALPSRRHIDPTEIPQLLPYVFLVDVIEDGREFRYRLLGTHIVSGVGSEFTGQTVREFLRDRACALSPDDYRLVIEQRAPRRSSGDIDGSRHGPVSCERILCPLAGDGTTIDMILGGLILQRDRKSA